MRILNHPFRPTFLVVLALFCCAPMGSAFAGSAGAWPFLAANQRFTPYGTAQDLVHDRVTGLLWQRTPDTTPRTWHAANWHCTSLWYPFGTGGQIPVGASQGFRLPTVEELGTMRKLVRVIVPTSPGPTTYEVQPMSDLFQGVEGYYWTSSNYPVNEHGNQGDAYFASFGTGLYPSGPLWASKSASDSKAWCVRGGSGLVIPGAEVTK